LLAVLTLFAITVITYAIVQLPPGDYVDAYIEIFLATSLSASTMNTGVMKEYGEVLRARWGLDRPIYIQYLKWMSNVVRGEFGMSMLHNKPIRDVLGDRMVMTVVLTLSTIMFTWVMAIPIGIYSAVRQRSVGDYTFTFLGFIGLATPDFLLALVMMYFAFVWFDFDVGGLQSRQYYGAGWSVGRILDLGEHLIIPVIVLGTSGTAGLIRIMRANLLDELRKPYVVTARAKGLRELRLTLKYPVRVALNPLISTVGYILPALISGSVIVSVVLSLPTVGPILLQSLLSEDMFLAGTIILFLGLLTIVGTLLSDILLVVLDPRIRIAGQ
jgi:peptide/nickel transport system permease protein